VVLLAAAACGGGGGDDGGGAGGTGELPYCERSYTDRLDAVCQAWNCAMRDPPTPAWTGSAGTCDPGDDPALRGAALDLTNAYRFLAGLAPVTVDETNATRAQACALLQHANRALSHDPPDDWACFTQDGRLGAGGSNIATADAWDAVHMFLVDDGANNADRLGHRRWILSPALERVGFGTTDAYACMWVVHPFELAEQAFVAWPPPGPVPAAVVHGARPQVAGSLDLVGWSIQSNRIDFSRATVHVTEDGKEVPVRIQVLGPNTGSRYALKIVPDGWRTAIGSTYAVHVDGVSEPIAYEFELVDCRG